MYFTSDPELSDTHYELILNANHKYCQTHNFPLVNMVSMNPQPPNDPHVVRRLITDRGPVGVPRDTPTPRGN